jgi:hypothetical protein
MSVDPKIDGGTTPPALFPPSGEVKSSGEVSKQQAVKGATFGDGVSVTPSDETSTVKHKAFVADTTPDVPVLPASEASNTDSKLKIASQVFTDSAVVVAGLASVTSELKQASLELAQNIVAGRVDASDNDKNAMLKGAVFSSKEGIANLYNKIGAPNGISASPAQQVTAINYWFATAPMAAIMAAMQEWIAMQQQAAIANTKMAVEMRDAKRALVQEQVATYKAEGDFNAAIDTKKGEFAIGKGAASFAVGIGAGFGGLKGYGEAYQQTAGQIGKSIDSGIDAGEQMWLAGTESSKTGFQATQTTLQDRGRALDNTVDTCGSAVQSQLDISTILQLAQAIKSTLESGSRFFA